MTGKAESGPQHAVEIYEHPHVQTVDLPGGAVLAVTIQLALEAWAPGTVGGNTLGTPLPGDAVAKGTPDYATVSAQLYGVRTGIYRLLDVMGDHGVVASCSTSGLIGQEQPAVVSEVASRGHEIVGHGWTMDRKMVSLDEDEDLDVVKRTTEALQAASGQQPVGWSSHGARRGTFTVDSLLRENYIYTNDFRDSDTPYVVARSGAQRLIAMPRSDELNDKFVITRHGQSPSVYVDYFKRAFDRLYLEGQRGRPNILTCTAHSTVLGHPWGAEAFSDCLAYVREHDHVWQTTRAEVARHYLVNLPE